MRSSLTAPLIFTAICMLLMVLGTQASYHYQAKQAMRLCPSSAVERAGWDLYFRQHGTTLDDNGCIDPVRGNRVTKP